WLNFDGINWKANVFLNGQSLGRIEGAFMRGKFNVTGLLRKGKNYLAVEILCNNHFAAIKEKDENTTQYNGGILGADNPTFHASVGWDWITTVRGREAGIWNEVYLTTTGNVTVSDPYVQTKIAEDRKTVSVQPSVFVHNNGYESVRGTLSGYIGDVRFERVITLPANTEQEIVFTPEQFPQLTSSDFRLWWPNGYGDPYLYDAGFTFEGEGITYKAGLREMTYVDSKDSLRIYVNGRRFIPLGGNWGFDEHNLLYRSREYDIAVGYHRDMNFTMIRNWVGQIGDEAFYEACDRHGIMIWQDFWLANPADGPAPYDDVLFLNNAYDYTRRMRSHASIGIYCGRNEGFPPEAIDRKLRQYVYRLAPGMEYISHSSSEGVSGGGPYRALSMKEYFEKQSGKIHSERGMPNVMNIESLHRTFSPDALWPQSRQWGQHDFTLQGAQRASEFNRLVQEGFGEASSADEFSRWAQLINYNGYRAMFESTSKSRAGLLLWMSHPCWPSMV
ncbi:MAG: beta-glycosidase, partial [Bacteroidaceae bacterium]|nr:beta-glycosidase [Bacteroidaceae bacterium]